MSIQKTKNKFFRKSHWSEGLYQKGNRFYARWTLPDGSRLQQSLKTDNLNTAKDQLIIIKNNALMGNLEKSYKNDLQDLLKEYWIAQAWRAKRSNKEQKSMIDMFLKFSKVTSLEGFTHQKVTKYLMGRLNDPKDKFGAVSFNKYRKCYVTFFSWLVNNEYWKENSMKKVRILPELLGDIVYLTQDQIVEQLKGIEKIIGEVQEKEQTAFYKRKVKKLQTVKALVATYLLAGLRRAEGLWLRREDVDLKNRMIHIRSKTIDGVEWRVKSGKSNIIKKRMVPMSRALYPYLKEQLASHKSGWVFPSPTGQGRWNDRNFLRTFQQVQKKLGLKFRCMDFRHTYGTQLSKKGVSMFKISKYMGNSVKIAEKYYIGFSPEEHREEIEFLSEQLLHELPQKISA